MTAPFQYVDQTSHYDPKGAQSQDVTWFEDFLTYTTASPNPFSLIQDAGANGSAAWDGTALDNNGAGDNCLLSCAATTQWAYVGLSTTNKLFLPVLGQSAMGIEAHLKFTSSASNTAQVFFGFSSLTTTLFPASGVAPSTSGSYMIIYRLSGSTQWQCIVSNGSTQAVQATFGNNGLCADGVYTLRVDLRNFSPTQGMAVFTVNGKEQVPGAPPFGLQLPFNYASLASMYGFCGIQAGSATGTQTMYVDYIQFNKSRGLSITNG